MLSLPNFRRPRSRSLSLCAAALAAYKIEIDLTVLSLALLKNILQPALVLVGLLSLGYGAPIVPEAVLTTAIPAMPIVFGRWLRKKRRQSYALTH